MTEIGLVAVAENHRNFSYMAASPLALQSAVPPDSGYLDWTNFGTSLGFGDIGDELLDYVLDYVEGRDDEGNLRINDVVDEFILGGEETLILMFDDTSVEVDELVLSLKEVKVDGLNSFRSLNVADPIGAQTLANEFEIERLSIEIVATMDILSTDEPPQEVSISFGVNDLSASLILFAAVNVEKVGNLPLGSIVNTNDLVSCVMSTVEALSVPSISITSVSLEKPEIKGLMSDTGTVLSTTLDRVFEQFRSNIEEAVPILMDTSVRKIVNSVVETLLDGADCPANEAGDGVVDYRAMFSGQSPYGNLPGLLMDLLRSNFFSADSLTGLARVNTLVRSWTENGSGVFSMAENFIDETTSRFRKIGINWLRFAFGEFSVENLDTIKAPVVLLEPVATNGTLLSNRIGLGGEPNPIRLSAEATLETRGDPELTSRNDMQLLVDITDIDAVAVVLAKLGLDELMSFPLKRILDANCWLALFHTDDGSRNLLVETLSLAVSSFVMRVECVDGGRCSSGLPYADALLKDVTTGEFGRQLAGLVLGVIEDAIEGEFFHSMLDDLIQESANACNGVPADQTIRRGQVSDTPLLSKELLQKVAALTMFGLEAGAVGIFETHSSFPTDWNPLSAQDALSLNATQLIDFTNFTTSIGDWANTLVDELRYVTV